MNSADYYLVLDSGTSSTKVFVVSKDGQIVFTNRRKHALHRPKPFYVESDAEKTLHVCKNLLETALRYVVEHHGNVIRCGLTVQRSTFLFWNANTLAPLTPALSWQDSRARDIVSRLSHKSEHIRDITGAPLSAHFGGPKYTHLIESIPTLNAEIQSGNVLFGPLSSYIAHGLTGQAFVDESIACRSLFMDIDTCTWSPELMQDFSVDPATLPPLTPTLHDFGNISLSGNTFPLSCVIGDQQAALIGQGGTKPQSLAMNFGTSGSIQFNTGATPKHIPELLSSVLYSNGDERYYLLEGTINACNSLFYWLEEELSIPHEDMLWHDRCEGQTTPGVLVPGFIGLAAPYWTDRFDTIQYQLDNVNTNEIIRAGMESIGFLVYDIVQSLGMKLVEESSIITASGGGARPPLLQFIADLLQRPIGHSSIKDRTAMGVFYLLSSLDQETASTLKTDYDQLFEPKLASNTVAEKIAQWHEALSCAGIQVRMV